MSDTMPHSDAAAAVCAFCRLPAHRVVADSRHAVLVRDAFPVSPGHSLIITRRHVGSFFELERAERDDALALLEMAKADLQTELHPNGFNIGVNDGPAAGQTIPHLHIHLIPRYTGDLPDPRGGVRWVIPHKADYWSHR